VGILDGFLDGVAAVTLPATDDGVPFTEVGGKGEIVASEQGERDS